MVIDKQLENELFDNGIYEAWQFVMNTARTLSTAEYCKETILRLLSSMQQECDKWKEALWNDLMTQESNVKKGNSNNRLFTCILNPHCWKRYSYTLLAE